MQSLTQQSVLIHKQRDEVMISPEDKHLVLTSYRQSSFKNWFGSILDSYFNFEVSVVVHSGISINNKQNSFGVDVYRAVLDVYHEDWEGRLVNIGLVQDRGGRAVRQTSEVEVCLDSTIQSLQHDKSSLYKMWESNRSIICSAEPKDNATTLPSSQDECPSFTIPSRKTTNTADDAISFSFLNVSPKTYLSVLYQFIQNKGTLKIPSSGVMHLKTSSTSVPLTVGVVCENTLSLTSPSLLIMSRQLYNLILAYFGGERQVASDEVEHSASPWLNIDKVDCNIDRLATGFRDADKMGGELRELLWKRHHETGRVLEG